jgi:hypothetical protein
MGNIASLKKGMQKRSICSMIDKHDNRSETTAKTTPSIVEKDSPDDFAYEGKFGSSKKALQKDHLGDKAYVTVDNPDDFE